MLRQLLVVCNSSGCRGIFAGPERQRVCAGAVSIADSGERSLRARQLTQTDRAGDAIAQWLLLAAQPELVTPVLQVVQRVVTRYLLDHAGLKAGVGPGGTVTLIQRFGSAANLNIHLHCLVLDGVYRRGADGVPVFVQAGAPSDDELHAAVRVEAHERKRLEQLCRTITWPALADERVQLNAAGQVELKLKTPWRDGTTHLVMCPLEFLQRLAARIG